MSAWGFWDSHPSGIVYYMQPPGVWVGFSAARGKDHSNICSDPWACISLINTNEEDIWNSNQEHSSGMVPLATGIEKTLESFVLRTRDSWRMFSKFYFCPLLSCHKTWMEMGKLSKNLTINSVYIQPTETWMISAFNAYSETLKTWYLTLRTNLQMLCFGFANQFLRHSCTFSCM